MPDLVAGKLPAALMFVFLQLKMRNTTVGLEEANTGSSLCIYASYKRDRCLLPYQPQQLR